LILQPKVQYPKASLVLGNRQLSEIPIVADHESPGLPGLSKESDIVGPFPSLFFDIQYIMATFTQEGDEARGYILIGQEPRESRLHPARSRST
jgi:hypothetical protein